MDWSVDKKINIGFALALALLILIGVVSFLSINRLIDTIRLLTYSHAVIDTLEDLSSHMKDAQRGERGFVLTGEERYLDPYHEALSLIDDELADLRGLIATDVNQRGRLATVEAGVMDNLAEFDEAIRLRRNEGFDAGVRAIRSGEGKHQMDSIGKIVVLANDADNAFFGEFIISYRF